ncbi:hypothetical protein [Caloramator proteoclasticus]|uniref:N(6)-L-threonylcarbamoyladenine synthase n=1 Tax=Caloramator proteoclasticus DSM 10124 TaxID=1121262 RepID=A0A1M4Y7A4_9CLOT|nr:hypothetical protein [Caloramator proteoclasticus]SHF01687.1 N6-L-threonylcarbamoyladenine synthase [Caloramator proteoclasticus DSM 10124]
MSRVLGIDTSNYTTSICIVEDNKVVCDRRKILYVENGKRGLRQSEALFQHIKNIPDLLNDNKVSKIDAVCVSTRPRPYHNSYMPVFKAGESIAKSISSVLKIPYYETTHQEGHIESAKFSIGFNEEEFIAIHISGGTSEILLYKDNTNPSIELIGGTKDISIGQFIDRVGVALGFDFPAGKYIDDLAINTSKTELVIPSKVDGFYFNLSGQETKAIGFLEKGYPKDEIALSTMKCVVKTLDKLINNIVIKYDKKVLLFGGVASSKFISSYLNERYKGRVYISKPEYSLDNAVGVALIGYKRLNQNRRDKNEQ